MLYSLCMKILIKQFLGKQHSWSVCGWGFAKSLKKLGHEVHLFSTDGIDHLPLDLKSNLIGFHKEGENKLYGSMPSDNYDCQISYTAMLNFPQQLKHGSKNRFGIWVYEWSGKNILPAGFAKNYKYCDYLISPSTFGKKVFMDSNIPEDIIKVIPHGIDEELYLNNSKIQLPTNKKYKILVNLAQNHLRKNIPGMLEAYGRAFTNKDDVCLLIKGKDKPQKYPFDVSLNECLDNFKKNYPNHAEIKLINNFIVDMSELYRSVDCVYTLANAEGFYFPGLEGLAAGKMSIAPNWGGQIDFLNESNSLLVSGKEVRANPKSMYWQQKNNAVWFEPSVEDAAEKLRYSYNNYESLNKKVESQRVELIKEYSWDNVASNFIKLCN